MMMASNKDDVTVRTRTTITTTSGEVGSASAAVPGDATGTGDGDPVPPSSSQQPSTTTTSTTTAAASSSGNNILYMVYQHQHQHQHTHRPIDEVASPTTPTTTATAPTTTTTTTMGQSSRRRQPSLGPPPQLHLQQPPIRRRPPPPTPTTIRRIRSKCPSEYSNSNSGSNSGGVSIVGSNRQSSIVSSASPVGAAAAATTTHHSKNASSSGATAASSSSIMISPPMIPQQTMMKKKKKRPELPSDEAAAYQIFRKRSFVVSSEQHHHHQQQPPPSPPPPPPPPPGVDTSFGTNDTGAAVSSLTSISSGHQGDGAVAVAVAAVDPTTTAAAGDDDDVVRNNNNRIHRGSHHLYRSVDTASLYRPIQPVREVMVEVGLMTIQTDETSSLPQSQSQSPSTPPVTSSSQHDHSCLMDNDDGKHSTSSIEQTQSGPQPSQDTPLLLPQPSPQPRRTVSQIQLEQRLETIRNDLLQFDDDDDNCNNDSQPEDMVDVGRFGDDTLGMGLHEGGNEEVLPNYCSSTPAVHDRKSLPDYNIHRHSNNLRHQSHVSLLGSSHGEISNSSTSEEEQTIGSRSVSVSVSVSVSTSEEEAGWKSESISVSSSEEEEDDGSKSESVSVSTSSSETSRKSSTSPSPSQGTSSSTSFSYSRVGGGDLEGASPASSRMVYKNRRRLFLQKHSDEAKEEQRQQQRHRWHHQNSSQSPSLGKTANTADPSQPMMVAVEDCVQFEPTQIKEHTSRPTQTTTTISTASKHNDKSYLATEDRSLNHVPVILPNHSTRKISARSHSEYQSSETSSPPQYELSSAQMSNEAALGGMKTETNDDGDEDNEVLIQYPLSATNMFAQGLPSSGGVCGMNETSSFTARPLERVDSAVTYQSLVSEITMNTYDKSPGPKTTTRGGILTSPLTVDVQLKIDKRAPQYRMALEQQRLESTHDKETTIRTTNQRSVETNWDDIKNGDQDRRYSEIETPMTTGPYRSASTEKDRYSTRRKLESHSRQTIGGSGSPVNVFQPAPLAMPQPPRRTLSPVPLDCIPPNSASQQEVRLSSPQTLPGGTTMVQQLYKMPGDDEESINDDKVTVGRELQVRDSIDPGIVRTIPFAGLRGKVSKEDESQKSYHQPQPSSPGSVSSAQRISISPAPTSRHFQDLSSTPGKETNPLCYPKGLPFVLSARDSFERNGKDNREEYLSSDTERIMNDLKNGTGSPCASPIRGPSHTGEKTSGHRSNQPHRPRKSRLPQKSDQTHDQGQVHKPKEFDLSDHSLNVLHGSIDLSQSDPNMIFEQSTDPKGLDLGGSNSSFHEDIDLSHQKNHDESNQRDRDLEVDFSTSGHLLKPLDISKHTPEQILRKQASGQRTYEAKADEINIHVAQSENADESEVSCYEENLNDMSAGDRGIFQRACVSEIADGQFSIVGNGGVSMSTIAESMGGIARKSHSGGFAVRSMPSVTAFSNSTESIPPLRSHHTEVSSSTAAMSSSVNKSTCATASSSESKYVVGRYRRNKQEPAVSSTTSTAVASERTAPTIPFDSTSANRNEQMVVHRAKNYPLEVEFVSSSILADHEHGGLLAPTINRYSGTYSGSLNKEWQPHGAGIFRFDATGDLYVGEFDCGNLHGCGVLKIHVGGCVPFQELDSKTGEVVLKWTEPKCHFLKGYFFLNEYIGSDPDDDWLAEIDRVRGYRWTSASEIDELVCDIMN